VAQGVPSGCLARPRLPRPRGDFGRTLDRPPDWSWLPTPEENKAELNAAVLGRSLAGVVGRRHLEDDQVTPNYQLKQQRSGHAPILPRRARQGRQRPCAPDDRLRRCRGHRRVHSRSILCNGAIDAKCGAGSGIGNFGPTRQHTYHAHAWALGGCRGLLALREMRHLARECADLKSTVSFGSFDCKTAPRSRESMRACVFSFRCWFIAVMFDFIRRKRANGFSPQYRHRRDGGRTDYVGGVRMTAVLSHLAPTTALPRHAAASVPVIPAERAGLCPASESRKPVNKTTVHMR
jgi:hypothetical protein